MRWPKFVSLASDDASMLNIGADGCCYSSQTPRRSRMTPTCPKPSLRTTLR